MRQRRAAPPSRAAPAAGGPRTSCHATEHVLYCLQGGNSCCVREGRVGRRGCSLSSSLLCLALPCRQLAADVAAAAEQLGLEGGESVLESFSCRLLQSYTSVSNFFTPVQQVR